MYSDLSNLIKKWYPNIKRHKHHVVKNSKIWPYSVQLFYSTIPLDDTIWSRQDNLLIPIQDETVNGLFKFMIENQGVVSWYFENKGDDPNTYVDSIDHKNRKIPQGKFSYLIKLLFYQNLKFKESNNLWGYIEPKDHIKIKNEYLEYFKGEVYWPGAGSSIYDCGNFVIEDACSNEDEGYVYISCINQETLNRMIKMFPKIEWDNIDVNYSKKMINS